MNFFTEMSSNRVDLFPIHKKMTSSKRVSPDLNINSKMVSFGNPKYGPWDPKHYANNGLTGRYFNLIRLKAAQRTAS